MSPEGFRNWKLSRPTPPRIPKKFSHFLNFLSVFLQQKLRPSWRFIYILSLHTPTLQLSESWQVKNSGSLYVRVLRFAIWHKEELQMKIYCFNINILLGVASENRLIKLDSRDSNEKSIFVQFLSVVDFK